MDSHEVLDRGVSSEPESDDRMTIADWTRRIRSEYSEMPGLHLTVNQAQRLWGLDAVKCKAMLGALVQTGFLRRTTAGAYVRADA